MRNIIFYFSDQQRWDTINEEITPNLCELASEGVLFENEFTCQPVCGPARACLQTGTYATQNGCWSNAIPLPSGTKRLPIISTRRAGKRHISENGTLARTNCPESEFTAKAPLFRASVKAAINTGVRRIALNLLPMDMTAMF